MAKTAADVLVERLIDWGVRIVFGLPGDGINGIMEGDVMDASGKDPSRPAECKGQRAVPFALCPLPF